MAEEVKGSGMVVELPFSFEDDVYAIMPDRRIEKCYVIDYIVYRSGNIEILLSTAKLNMFGRSAKDIGKTVFRTMMNAEKAVK